MCPNPYAVSVPVQLLQLFGAADAAAAGENKMAAARAAQYAADAAALAALLAAGVTHKKSAQKGSAALAWLPTNSHWQTLRVRPGAAGDAAEHWALSSHGAFAAHALKFTAGGLPPVRCPLFRV